MIGLRISLMLILSLSFIGYGGIAPLAYAQSPTTHPYLVIKTNVHIRNAATNKAKRIGRLAPREVVNVILPPQKELWLEIKHPAHQKAFVFHRSVTPLIDARLPAPLTGQITIEDETTYFTAQCHYVIQDQGRTEEDEVIFITRDYGVSFDCTLNGSPLHLNAFMFMSEIPPDLGNRPLYQITLDFPEIAENYEDYLSIGALYYHDEKTVHLDYISLESYGSIPKTPHQSPVPASTPQHALQTALALQMNSLSTKGWDALASANNRLAPEEFLEHSEENSQ